MSLPLDYRIETFDYYPFTLLLLIIICIIILSICFKSLILMYLEDREDKLYKKLKEKKE